MDVIAKWCCIMAWVGKAGEAWGAGSGLPSPCRLDLGVDGHIIQVRWLSSLEMANQMGKPKFKSWNVQFQEISNTLLVEDHLEIPREGRVFIKTKTFKGKYKAKLEFPEEKGGGGVKPKKTVGGGRMDISWNHTSYNIRGTLYLGAE